MEKEVLMLKDGHLLQRKKLIKLLLYKDGGDIFLAL